MSLTKIFFKKVVAPVLPGAGVGETLVTVEFHDLGAATEVVVTHELFPSEAARDQHQQGWSVCLDHLAESV